MRLDLPTYPKIWRHIWMLPYYLPNFLPMQTLTFCTGHLLPWFKKADANKSSQLTKPIQILHFFNSFFISNKFETFHFFCLFFVKTGLLTDRPAKLSIYCTTKLKLSHRLLIRAEKFTLAERKQTFAVVKSNMSLIWLLSFD